MYSYRDGETFGEIVGEATARSVHDLYSSTGFNAARSADFWEAWLAVQLGGRRTAHSHAFDVEVDIWGRSCKAEVKFSQAFLCRFSNIRGRDWSRPIWKWTMTAPQAANRPADAIVLVGIDVDDRIYAWVVPAKALRIGCRSITATATSSRKLGSQGKLDDWSVPFTQILPRFAQIAHNTYDGEHRRANAALTRSAKRGQPDLFGRAIGKPGTDREAHHA